MSRYVREITVKRKYGDDDITVVLKPMKFGDLLTLQSKGNAEGETSMLAAFTEMLPRYVISLEGAKDSAGQSISLDDLGDAYWARLIGEWMVAVVEAATVEVPT